MRALLVSPIGFLIGLSMGALGSGGAIIAVPVLIYLAGQSPKEATASSLVLIASTACVGLIPHLKAKRVHGQTGLIFAGAGIPANLIGSRLNADVSDNALLLGFALLMLTSAASMTRSLRQKRRNQTAPPQTASTRTRLILSTQVVTRIVIAGTIVGLVTGFFGVGGGFVIVPVLVLAFRFSMAEAAATSLLIIVVNSCVALSTRLTGEYLDWSVIAPFGLASLAGVITGGRLANKVDAQRLQVAFVGLTVCLAIYTGTRSVIGLL